RGSAAVDMVVCPQRRDPQHPPGALGQVLRHRIYRSGFAADVPYGSAGEGTDGRADAARPGQSGGGFCDALWQSVGVVRDTENDGSGRASSAGAAVVSAVFGLNAGVDI